MSSRGKADNMGLMAEKAFKEAVVKALEMHKKLGIPAVYMKNGKMVYLLPNGKEVETPPVLKKKTS